MTPGWPATPAGHFQLKGQGLPTSALLLTLALAVAALWLLARLLRAGQARVTARAGYFGEVAGLFTDVTTRLEPSGFARMAGVWNGARFDLQAVPDTLTFRKLPVLWVLITLTEPMPVPGEVHIMARPGQDDTFSRFSKMPVSVALPPEFPEYCALRCSAATALPAADLMAARGALFSTGIVKELVIAPQALRLVILGDEAERGAYLLFREAELGQVPLMPDRLIPHLRALLHLRADLDDARESARARESTRAKESTRA